MMRIEQHIVKSSTAYEKEYSSYFQMNLKDYRKRNYKESILT